ncbi:uncharacterized protein BO88DRAFT_429055 [Aspergillus vadensis CBS 113365]|uniref:Uncharacterized protein n=1 Tax=Aspergillus vadensis (strain CBS 113365 / IMI 142717 / IBT 24658) TaxID=1448311 RepID=A0A319AZZ9_ASPVC|nr:hypothetical protein BO88DRAFT_429055 [Aspergillus vadensis CBS 113365]PYH65001.1 hypothetical protein BO88DRAFT_429055 [Aspergillus vadensis CBS 113365]
MAIAACKGSQRRGPVRSDWLTGVMGMDLINFGCNDTVTVLRILQHLAKRHAKTWHYHGFTMGNAPLTTTQQSALFFNLEAPCSRITVMYLGPKQIQVIFRGSSGTVDVKLPIVPYKYSAGRWDCHTGSSLVTCISSSYGRRGGIGCLTRTRVDTGCEVQRAKFWLPPGVGLTPTYLHCKKGFSPINSILEQSEPNTCNLQPNHEQDIMPSGKTITIIQCADTPTTISKMNLPSHESKAGDDRRPVRRCIIAKHGLPAGGALLVGFGDISLGSPHGRWAPSSVATDTGSYERGSITLTRTRHTYTWLDRYFRLINLLRLGTSNHMAQWFVGAI